MGDLFLESDNPKGYARLAKWLRRYVEVVVEQSAWVRIPHLANFFLRFRKNVGRL